MKSENSLKENKVKGLFSGQGRKRSVFIILLSIIIIALSVVYYEQKKEGGLSIADETGVSLAYNAQTEAQIQRAIYFITPPPAATPYVVPPIPNMPSAPGSSPSATPIIQNDPTVITVPTPVPTPTPTPVPIFGRNGMQGSQSTTAPVSEIIPQPAIPPAASSAPTTEVITAPEVSTPPVVPTSLKADWVKVPDSSRNLNINPVTAQEMEKLRLQYPYSFMPVNKEEFDGIIDAVENVNIVEDLKKSCPRKGEWGGYREELMDCYNNSLNAQRDQDIIAWWVGGYKEVVNPTTPATYIKSLNPSVIGVLDTAIIPLVPNRYFSYNTAVQLEQTEEALSAPVKQYKEATEKLKTIVSDVFAEKQSVEASQGPRIKVGNIEINLSSTKKEDPVKSSFDIINVKEGSKSYLNLSDEYKKMIDAEFSSQSVRQRITLPWTSYELTIPLSGPKMEAVKNEAAKESVDPCYAFNKIREESMKNLKEGDTSVIGFSSCNSKTGAIAQ